MNVLSDGEEGPSSGDLWDSVLAGLDPSGEGRGEGQRTRVNLRPRPCVPERRAVLLTEIGKRSGGRKER